MNKNFAIIALTAALLLAAVGCGAQKPVVTSSSQVSSAEASSSEASSSEAFTESGAEMIENAEKGVATAETKALVVMDAAQYRGIVEDFSVSDDGKTVLTLRQADGTDFGHPVLKVMLDENTKYAVNPPQFANASYLEIYYGNAANPDGSVTAIAVNELEPADMILFNGTVAEITPDPEKADSGSILVKPLQEGGMDFQFNYAAETQFRIPLAELKVGDKVNVRHSAATTRSIPPQSAALEINSYVPGETASPPITLG